MLNCCFSSYRCSSYPPSPRYVPFRCMCFLFSPSTQTSLRTSSAESHPIRLGLYTILPLPISYCVWHTQGGSGGDRILPSSRAIVLQQCGQCRRAGRTKGRLIRGTTISCKGQDTTDQSGFWILIFHRCSPWPTHHRRATFARCWMPEGVVLRVVVCDVVLVVSCVVLFLSCCCVCDLFLLLHLHLHILTVPLLHADNL